MKSDPTAHYADIEHPRMWGAVYGLLSAVGYTLTNVFLKASTHVDPIWVSCMKAVPTVLICAPWLLWNWRKGEKLLPAPHVVLLIVLAGLIGQVVANCSFQWSLGEINLAISAPITMGSIIVCGAYFGRIALGESLTPRLLLATGILLVAIFTLSLGAQQAKKIGDQETPTASVTNKDQAASEISSKVATEGSVALGVSLAIVAGAAYSVLGVVMRYGSSQRASMPITLFIVGICGVLVLGGISLIRFSLSELFDLGWQTWLCMLAAGTLNALSFIALARSLQLVDLAFVNALNASQVAMAAIAGVLIFAEPITVAMVAGVLLTVAGLLFLRRSKAKLAESVLAAETAAAETPAGLPEKSLP